MSVSPAPIHSNNSEVFENPGGHTAVADEEKVVGDSGDRGLACDIERGSRDARIKDPNLVSQIFSHSSMSCGPY